MNGSDVLRTIVDVSTTGPTSLCVVWSDGTIATLDLAGLIDRPELRESEIFSRVEIGEWGHSLIWPNDIEIGAETLWLETLAATGHDDTRRFLAWRLRHGLSLSKAAEALGVSRRTIAYYSNGERKIPKPILLACVGWEAELARAA